MYIPNFSYNQHPSYLSQNVERSIEDRFRIIVLVCSGSYNIMSYTVAYKQQKMISHSSRNWEIQDQGTGKFSVW